MNGVNAKGKGSKQVIWVVMHYEIMGPSDSRYVDSVQFHVSSSLKKAEKFIRGRGVDSHSWWQIHPHVLDTHEDEGNEVHYYSHRGTPLKSAPMSRAFAAFARHVARYPEFYSHPPKQL